MTQHPAIPLLGMYLEKTNSLEKTLIRKDTCTPKFTAALFTIARTQKQPKCPSTDEWIRKMCFTHTHTQKTSILLSHKKECLFATSK